MIHKFSRYLLTLVALLTMTTGAWAQTVTVTWTLADLEANPDVTTFTKDGVTLKCDTRMSSGKSFVGPVTFSTTLGNFTKIEITGSSNAPISSDQFTNGDNVSTWTGNAASISDPNSIAYATQFVFTIAPAAAEVKVDISDDQTSAEFDMPSYDATLEYDIVRNLASNMTVSVGDGQDGYRIRVKKQGESFVPAEMTLQQMMALYTVHDATEQKDLLFYGDGKVCDISIFAVDDQGQPTGDAIAFTALTPGRYVAIATAPDDSPLYAGQTPQSNIFVLYQGYEVTVPAGEYITYYKDEALYVEDEDAKLYTITAVGEQTATATELTIAKANMPILVKNTSEETKTILLIPTTDDATEIDAAAEFVGTLEATTIAASTDELTNYALNGKQFVWVKDAIEVGANKAWLAIPTGANARTLTIVFGDATGIDASLVNSEEGIVNGDWYDLNGRKINIPTKKGVYIINGKKVVVK